MKSIVFNSNGVTIASYMVGALAMLLIYSVISEKRVPIIGSDKAAFILLWILGFGMSLLAGFRDYPDGKFTLAGFPLTILMILGFLAVGVLIVKLIGVKLSWSTTYRQAFNLTSGIIMVKWVVVHLHKLWVFSVSLVRSWSAWIIMKLWSRATSVKALCGGLPMPL